MTGSSIQIEPPFQFFTALDGTALEGGKIYVGVAGLDAETNPITVYWDAEKTTSALQPIRTIAGIPDNGGTPANFFSASDYSITIRGSDDTLVYSSLSALAGDDFGQARFNTSGDGVTLVFTLPVSVSSVENLTVFIDSNYQSKNSFSVTGDNLTFSEPPPPGDDNIEVLILIANVVAGQTADSILTSDGESVQDKIDQAAYDTRALFAADVLAGKTWQVGEVVFAGGQMYQKTSGATDISDILGWLPYVDISTAHFGSVGDGVADDTGAINAALDYAFSIGGGRVLMNSGTYLVTSSGAHRTSRFYCLLVKSNVSLEGEAPGSVVINYIRTNDDTDVIISPETGSLESPGSNNIHMRNILVDGNFDSGGTGKGMNIWLANTKRLALENTGSINGANWNCRIEQCDGVSINNYWSEGGAEINSDGFHIVDCHNFNVVAEAYTEGDDAFAITAQNKDILNGFVKAIVRAPVTVAAAGRGLLLNLGDGVAPGITRRVDNLRCEIIAENCKGSALAVSGALDISNCTFDIVADGCASAASVFIGNTTDSGSMINSLLSIRGRDLASYGFITTSLLSSVITGNTINASIYNPGDGVPGVVLHGDEWYGSVLVDYDPDGTKSSQSFGVDIHGSDNNLTIASKGADANVNVRTSALSNTIHLGKLADAVTSDIVIVAGHTDGPRFIGGSVNTVTNPLLASWSSVKGATDYGVVDLNFTTNADGTASFAHGLVGTPSGYQVTLKNGGSQKVVQASVVDGTNVTVKMTDTAGALITSGTFTFSYNLAL